MCFWAPFGVRPSRSDPTVYTASTITSLTHAGLRMTKRWGTQTSWAMRSCTSAAPAPHPWISLT